MKDLEHYRKRVKEGLITYIVLFWHYNIATKSTGSVYNNGEETKRHLN